MEKKNVLNVKELTTGFKDTLFEGSFSFEGGDFVALVGENGIGKTTLLRTLAGLIPRKGGRIFHNQNDVSSLELSELAEIFSIVTTPTFDMPYLSIYDVVSLGRMPYTGLLGKLSQNDKDKIDEAMQSCGVSSIASKFIMEASDGERQKAFIAKAICQEARVMLLDEPTSFLDFKSKRELMKLLSVITQQQKKIVIVSSHDLDLLSEFCNKFLILHSAGEFEILTDAMQFKEWLTNLRN